MQFLRTIHDQGFAMPDDEPNKLLGSEIDRLSDDPLIGVLRLDTDEGEIEVVVNRAGAEELARQLADFLMRMA